MSRFVIKGGRPVSGVHRVPGNKNAALPMLAASLLTAEPVTLSNLPLIADVRTMLELLSDMGAEVELNAETRTVRICAPERQQGKDRTGYSKAQVQHHRL